MRRIEARTGSRVRVARLADTHLLDEARVRREADDAPIRVFRPSVRATGQSGKASPLVVRREGRAHRDSHRDTRRRAPRPVTVDRHPVHDRSRIVPRTVDKPGETVKVKVKSKKETVKVKVKAKEHKDKDKDKRRRRR